MRFDNVNFDLVNQSQTKSPRYTIELAFDTDATDLYYFTSHDDAAIPSGVSSTDSVINSLSVTSQSLDPLNARTTIGNISFTIQDKDGFLSTLLKTKDEGGDGIRQKRVRVYVGDQNLAWDDYQLIQTQIIGVYSNKDKVYSFKCEDVQRSVVKNIFDKPFTNLASETLAAPKVTALTATFGAGVATATVDDTTGFPASGKFIVDSEIVTYTGVTATTFTGCTRGELFTSDVSHSSDAVITEVTAATNCVTAADFELIEHGTSYTDAPSATVGYFKIDDEIIRYYSTTSTTFVNCVRGVLNTKAVEHVYDAAADADRRPKIEAYIYYEMPALKLAYAILTGDLYTQSGKTLESYCHLDISTTFVATSKFIQHYDLWLTTDDTEGFIVRFEGLKKQDAMQFLQKEIYQLLGSYSPILSDGQLSFERTTGVLSDSSYVAVLDSSNIISYSGLNNDTANVHNQIDIRWNWDEKAQNTTRKTTLIDQNSIDKHLAAPAITKVYRGLHGGIHTTNIINQQFDSLRDRYAGPPLKISVTCFHRMNYLEVGDIVRLTFNGVEDHTNENNTTTDLDRSFEIQKISVDWVTGNCTFDLFGSSDKAAPIASSTGASFLDNSYYTSAGTDITTVLTGSPSGGVFHVTGNGTLTGHATDNTQAIYYCDTPIEFDTGTVTTVTGGNIMLRVLGHCQVNGKIDLKGIGHSGASGTVSGQLDFNPGTSGYIGSSLSAGGIVMLSLSYVAFPGDSVEGIYSTMPELDLTNNGASLSGIPLDIRGTSGSSGGPTGSSQVWDYGGAGGSSGGGCVFVSRGIDFGVNGQVDTSGDDGALANLLGIDAFETTLYQYPGTGGGGSPGGVYFLVDGSTSTVGTINVTANQGLTATQGLVMTERVMSFVSPPGFGNNTYTLYISNGNEAVPHSNSSHRVQYIPANLTPSVDESPETSKPIKIALAEVTNTPESLSENLASIEVTVTEPTDTNYYATNLYAKLSTNTEYKLLGSADQETVQIATMDGSTYDFRAYGVSLAGLETEDYVEKSITLSDTTGGVNMVDGNYLGINKDSFTSTANGVFMEATATGGRAVFGGATNSVTITDTGDVTMTGTVTAEAGAIGGFDIGATTLTGGTTNIILDSGNKAISINSATYATAGIQFQYNSGSPRLYVGDGSTEYLKYDGTNLELGGGTAKELVFEVYTSGLMRSNASPSTNGGFQLDTAGLRLWDSSGNLNVDIDTGNGYLNAKGAILSGSAADENLVPNNAFDFSYDGWVLIGGTAPGTPISVANDATEGNYLVLPHDATGYGYGSKTFKLVPLKKYRFRIRMEHDGLPGSGDDDGFIFRLSYKKLFADPITSVNRDGFNDFIATTEVVIEDDWTTYEFDYTPPAGAFWGSVHYFNWTDSTRAFHIAWVEVLAYGRFGDIDSDFAIGDATYQNAGIQMQYNAGTPRMYIGDGADKSVEFDGTDLVLGRDSKLLGGLSYNNNALYFDGFLGDHNYRDNSLGGAAMLNLGPDAKLRVDATSESCLFDMRTDYAFNDYTWDKDIRLKFRCRSPNTTSAANCAIGVGAVRVTGVFRAIEIVFNQDGNIYGITRDGTTETSSSLQAYVSSTSYTIEIVFTTGTDAEFFIGGVSKATNTTNLPTGTTSANSGFAGFLSSNTAGTYDAFIGQFKFNQGE